MAFLSWGQWSVYRRVTRAKIAKRVAAISRDRLQLSLWQWSDSVKEKRANEHRVRKLLGRLLGQKQMVCFHSWSDFVTEQKNDRTKVLRHLMNRGLSAAFSSWAMMVADAIHEREDEKDQLASGEALFIAACFHRWAGAMVAQRDRLLSLQSQVTPQQQQQMAGDDWSAIALRTNSSNLIRCSSMTLSDLSLPPSSAARPASLHDGKPGTTISAENYFRARSQTVPTSSADAAAGSAFSDGMAMAQRALGGFGGLAA